MNGRTGRNIIFSEVGLTLQFVVGDKDEILDAVEQSDFDFIHRLQNEKRLADFSLHLIPDDLNLLVNAAAELLGERLFGLRENLDLSEYGVDAADVVPCWLIRLSRTYFPGLSRRRQMTSLLAG